MIRDRRAVFGLCFLLGGCALPNGSYDNESLSVPRPYTLQKTTPSDAGAQPADQLESLVESTPMSESDARLSALKPIESEGYVKKSADLPRELFRNKGPFKLATENMKAKEWVHYVFGDLLGVSYVLDPNFSDIPGAENDIISLQISDAMSGVELFDFASELLSRQGIHLEFDSDILYVTRLGSGTVSDAPVIGIGRSEESVPKSSKKILQVVPLKYGIKASTERTLRTLLNVKITPDFAQSALFIEGQRSEIIQALELVALLDTPAMRGRNIGLVKLEHLAAESFGSKVSDLLKNEGIDIGINNPLDRNLSLVPIPHLNSVAIFATDTTLFDRVVFWAEVIDVPNKELSAQYFVYSPLFSRAKDLGATVKELLGIKDRAAESMAENAGITGNAPSQDRSSAVTNGKVSLVIDEKANAIIFFAEPSQYESLLPLMRAIDVPPRQVMLDILIAEVSLKDEFKYGVEWAVQRGEVSLTTQGAFGESGVGGIGIAISGSEGPLDASFLGSNSLVKVLSNPSILVRDGVSASIDVGSDVSVVGTTTSDPINGERQTTSSEYRKTGVSVSVTPSINSLGTVVMEINQTISNSVPGSSGASGNPDIFERSIKTEVVAESLQTVLLGGLISESTSKGGSGVPGFSKLPLLGSLFKSASDSTDRTELIMLITPKVLNDLSELQLTRDAFADQLKYLRLDD